MRDDFTQKTTEVLAKRVAQRCSNTECAQSTSGPGSDSGSAVNLGVAAHITAAAPGGPRYNPGLTSEERRSPSNGIWLCQTCAKLIDSDENRFDSATLRAWKQQAESEALKAIQAGVPSRRRVATLRKTLDGHTNYVWDVVITPDGRRVLSASNDTTVRMWDVASGNHLATFSGHQAAVCSVAVSAAGRSVAAGAMDGSVLVWELTSTAQRCRLEHGAADAKVGWGLKEDDLLTGGADGVLRIWKIPSCRETRAIRAHEAPILKVVFLDDGDRLVSISADKTIRVCSLASGECIRVCTGHTGEVNSVAISADKKTMVSASEDRTIRVWDLASGDCTATLSGHSDIVWRIAVSPDGALAASGSADDTVRIWDLTTNECVQELPHPDCVAAVTFSPAGDTLAVGCDDSRVYLYTIAASGQP
jgi:WD40 repeat protein